MAGLRKQIMEAIDEAVSSGARLFKACEAIHLCIRRLRRWRKTEGDGRKGGYRAVAQKLSEPEKDAIVLALELPSVKDLPVKVAHATLMDQGIYLGSPSTYVRVAAERNVRKARKVLVSKPKRPELVATGPGQVWCWDISVLQMHGMELAMS